MPDPWVIATVLAFTLGFILADLMYDIARALKRIADTLERLEKRK